ncbi:MAG: hypothetical protein ACRELA_10005 [Candidatus Rokuibacteriota bacterium]
MLVLVLVALVVAAFCIPFLERLADAGVDTDDHRHVPDEEHPERFRG